MSERALRVRPVFALVAPMLSRAAAVMWAAYDGDAVTARDRYRRWLLTCHDLVRATSPLLSCALTESLRRGETALAAYFAEQSLGELGHEQWVEQDWIAAGHDRAELTSRVPRPAAARLAGAQYYWILHAHPVALLGHIAMLEWLPPPTGLADELARQTGLPPAAFRTLAAHAELDLDHGAALDEVLATLDPAFEELVTTSALTTASALTDLMIELGAGHGDIPG